MTQTTRLRVIIASTLLGIVIVAARALGGGGAIGGGGALNSSGGGGSGDITAVGSMTTGDAFADATADDQWIGLGASACRLEFDDQATDEANFLSCNVGIGDTSPAALLTVGSGDLFQVSSAGQVKFNGVATDITTGTNESLLIAPNGTGSIQLQDGSNAISLINSSGTAVGTLSTGTTNSRLAILNASGSDGFTTGGTNGASIGKATNANATTRSGCFGESLTNAGATGLVCAYGGGFLAIETQQSATCTDSGNGSPAALSLDPTSSIVNVTNSDADGCVITLSETSAVSGANVTFVVISTAGGVVTFDDTANVHNSPTCANTTGLGLGDTYRVTYAAAANPLYVGLGCSDN